MNKMQKNTHVFTKMNDDADLSRLENGEYKFASSFRLISKNGNLGAVENAEGCELVDFTLPAGENRVIGYAKDDTNACGYYFVWNENNVHSILRYDNISTSITLLWQSEVGNDILKFDKDFLITHARVVDNFLLWTDGLNPVSQINITRALAGEYLTPQIEQQIRLGKQPPHYPPTVTYQQDPKIKQNYVSGKVFQFAVRYIYIDDQVSTLSPYSKVTIDVSANDPKNSTNNLLLVNYGVDLLGNNLPIKSNPVFRQLIKAVEILVRGSDYNTENNALNIINVNRADWKTVAVIDNFDAVNYTYKFYNNSLYQLISTNETRLYEALPIHAGCLEVKDNRVFLANNNEDRNKEPIDIELNIDFGDYGFASAGSTDPNDYDITYPINMAGSYVDNQNITCSTQVQPFCECFRTEKIYLFAVGTPVEYKAIYTFNFDIVSSLVNPPQPNGSSAQFVVTLNDSVIGAYEIITNPNPVVGSITIPERVYKKDDVFKVELWYTIGAIQIFNVGEVDEYFECSPADINIVTNDGSLVIDVTEVIQVVDTKGVLKRGGNYQYGLVYFDENNRYSVVHDKGNVLINGIANTENKAVFRLPFFTEDISLYLGGFTAGERKRGAAGVSWKIKHKPPIWATHYAWVRTKNLAYARFTQWQIQQVLYVDKYEVNTDGELLENVILPVVGTTPPIEANEIYLSVENFDFFNDVHSDSSIGTFLPEITDRIRFIAKRKLTGTNPILPAVFDWSYDGLIDVPIKARRGKWIVIDAKQLSLELLRAGDMVEMYTPKLQSSQEVFYEINEVFPILNPKTANRFHGKGYEGQDQTALLPATGTFKSGDVYYRQRTHIRKQITAGQEYTKPYPTYVQSGSPARDTLIYDDFFIESTQISDFFFSEADDTGRIAVADKNAKNRQKGNFIRFSDVYIPNTKINGLSTFQPLNEKDLPIEYGSVNALRNASSSQVEGNVMLALMTTNSLSLYIGRAVLTQQGGGQLTAIADQVINTVNELDGGYGCQNPESVVENNGYVYYFDARKGRLLRYASNGLFPISNYGFSKFFSDRGREMRRIPSINEKRVFGGFDVRNGEYIVTFTHPTFYPEPQPAITIAFSESSDGFSTFFPYAPEYFGNVGSEMLLFKEGELWRANSKNVPYNNFFGVQYATELHFAEQQYPFTDKIFQTIVSKSSFSADNEFFYAYEFQTNLNQLSVLDKNSYNRTPFTDPRLESDFYASILRDTNTPVANALFNGDLLRGQFMLVKMRCEAETLCLLRFVEVGFVASSGQ